MSRFSVKKPMTIFVAVIIVLALGIVSLVKMTPDLLPSIDLPYVVVMTTYPGATPEEVEQTVSKPLEQNLATVENLKSLQSISNANYSLVVLEFENDADMNTAIVNTMQGVDLVEGSWDEEIGSPYIMKINPNMMPIAIAAVDKKGATTEEVSTFVEDELMNQLEGITGVASISTGGLIESKVNVSINEDKIEKLNKKLLGEASPSLANAKGKLSSGLAQIKKAEAKLAESRKTLEQTKNDTYDKLAQTSAQLDVAVARAGALETQIKTLEGRKAAIEAQISQGIYGSAAGITLAELQEQQKDVESQLTILQMDGVQAEAQVSQPAERVSAGGARHLYGAGESGRCLCEAEHRAGTAPLAKSAAEFRDGTAQRSGQPVAAGGGTWLDDHVGYGFGCAAGTELFDACRLYPGGWREISGQRRGRTDGSERD